jgi:hypothetical protein
MMRRTSACLLFGNLIGSFDGTEVEDSHGFRPANGTVKHIQLSAGAAEKSFCGHVLSEWIKVHVKLPDIFIVL